MNTTLSKALREFTTGPLNQLIVNLGGQDGEQWEGELKKFLHKEPCWSNGQVTQVAEPKSTPSILELVSTVASRQPLGSSSPKRISFVTLAAKPRSRSATSATTSPLGSCRARVKPKTQLAIARLRSVTTSCGSPRWTVQSSLSSVAKRKLKPPCRRCSPSWRSRRTVKTVFSLNNGYANIFYINDFAGMLRAVVVGWGAEAWRVGVSSVEDPGRWGDGNHVFSRFCS